MPIYVINLAGALNALLVAIVLVSHPRLRGAPTVRYLAGLLAAAAVVIGMITLEHAEILWPRPAIIRLEESLSLLAGVFLVSYVCASLGRGRPGAWVYLPWAAHLAASLLGRAEWTGWLDMSEVMWVQMIYTASSIGLFLHHRRRARPPRHVAVILGIFVWVHAAQLIRFFWQDVPGLRDIVPWASSLAFFGLLIYALVQSRAVAGLMRRPVGEDAQCRMAEIIQRLSEYISSHAPWRDPNLTLESLARALDVKPGALSAAINTRLGESLTDYVNRLRVTEAKRLLRDVSQQRYTVEGLGREAGFGSRASFYRIFRQHTGKSPAEYRRDVRE